MTAHHAGRHCNSFTTICNCHLESSLKSCFVCLIGLTVPSTSQFQHSPMLRILPLTGNSASKLPALHRPRRHHLRETRSASRPSLNDNGSPTTYSSTTGDSLINQTNTIICSMVSTGELFYASCAIRCPTSMVPSTRASTTPSSPENMIPLYVRR